MACVPCACTHNESGISTNFSGLLGDAEELPIVVGPESNESPTLARQLGTIARAIVGHLTRNNTLVGGVGVDLLHGIFQPKCVQEEGLFPPRTRRVRRVDPWWEYNLHLLVGSSAVGKLLGATRERSKSQKSEKE